MGLVISVAKKILGVGNCVGLQKTFTTEGTENTEKTF
jgi:hypothetical protein